MKFFNWLLRTNNCFDFEEYNSFKNNVLYLEKKFNKK